MQTNLDTRPHLMQTNLDTRILQDKPYQDLISLEKGI